MKPSHTPLIWLIIAMIVLSLRDIFFAYHGEWPDKDNYLEGLLLFFPVACWVFRDSREKGIVFPADWALLATTIFLPIYFYRSRGFKGIGIFMLCALGWFVYYKAESELCYRLNLRASIY